MIWHILLLLFTYIYARCGSVEILCDVDFSSFFFRSRRISTILSLRREEVFDVYVCIIFVDFSVDTVPFQIVAIEHKKGDVMPHKYNTERDMTRYKFTVNMNEYTLILC